MGHTASIDRQRRSFTVTQYDESTGAIAEQYGSYTPAQMQALYLSRGRPDMAFMSNQERMPVEVPERQQTCMVTNHVNLKKDTLKLKQSPVNSHKYRLEFQFDATKPCHVSVYLLATETIDAKSGCSSFAQIYSDNLSLPTQQFPAGSGQLFKLKVDEKDEKAKENDEKHEQPLSFLDLSTYGPDELIYKADSMRYPLIIVLEVLSDKMRPQSQTTFCTFMKNKEDSWDLKMLKQKVLVDGVTYELQEIYGIDGLVTAAPKPECVKAGQAEVSQAGKDEVDISKGAECVICFGQPRNTTILPCRHMCLCIECAEALCKSSSTCPICRTRVESLLLIRVDVKRNTTTGIEDDEAIEVDAGEFSNKRIH